MSLALHLGDRFDHFCDGEDSLEDIIDPVSNDIACGSLVAYLASQEMITVLVGWFGTFTDVAATILKYFEA